MRENHIELQHGVNRSHVSPMANIPASSPFHPAIEDWERFSDVVQSSLTVKRRLELLLWLQGELQYFLPHEVLIVAWGNFRLGQIHYDVVSALPTAYVHLSDQEITPFIRQLYARWVDYDRLPFGLGAAGLNSTKAGAIEDPLMDGHLPPALRNMQSALVHGIEDQRSHHDCLYVALHSVDIISPKAHKNLEILLPYIDTALRRVSHLHAPHYTPQPTRSESLSAREQEVLEWVRKGKTNHEIGLILTISAFTVKNHLQRIFRKLDVINRAQAVGEFADGMAHKFSHYHD
jgi:transcriptional regulator EpsA